MINKNTPIIIGVGQTTQRWQVGKMPDDPLKLMQKSATIAIKDCQNTAITQAIDHVYVVNIFSHGYEDAAGSLAKNLGIKANHTLYPPEGGNTPQYLVNTACLALEKGDAKAVLIAGGEATYGARKALKTGLKLDWGKKARAKQIDGEIRLPLNEVEMAYELYPPANIYPLFETALRAHKRRSPEEHQHFLGQLYEKFAQKAAQNPLAWTQEALSATDIALPSVDNRMVCYPYPKRLNANILVDQSSAIILTTVGEAEQMNIPQEKWVFVSGGAALNEVWEVSRRPKLYESAAIKAVAEIALTQAGKTLDDITAFDFYSCFPCAVQMAGDAIGLSEEDPRPRTLTGGLSFFGGPANNYVGHSIAAAVAHIRQKPEANVLLNAVGWYMSKHALGIYSKTPPQQSWESIEIQEKAAQSAIDAQALPPIQKEANGRIQIEAFTIRYDREGLPSKGLIIGTLPEGNRALAYVETDAQGLTKMQHVELVGSQAEIYYDTEKKRNFVRLNL